MLENAVYSVITPEGCAAILWKDAGKAGLAAESLRLTAGDLQLFGLVDEIISEEKGNWKLAAEKNSVEISNFDKTTDNVKKAILKNLSEINFMNENEK